LSVRRPWVPKMSDFVKGSLTIGGWLAVMYVVFNVIPPSPSSNFMLNFLAVLAAFIFVVFIVDWIDKSIYPKATTSVLTSPYPENWESIRKKALKRDGYQCGNCGSTNRLHVHHIVPLSKDGTNNLSNLRTLCEGCHKKLHPHMR